MSDNNIYVQAYYKGGMQGFEIIPHGNNFEVAKSGEIIATLQHNETWQQISGEELPDDVLQSIYQQIERPESQA